MKKALIIFAREPIPGKAKTRLAQDVGEHAAAELYAAMLADVLEKAVSLDDVRPMVFWALENADLPLPTAFPQLEMFAQHGADLGIRMEAAFQQAFQSGLDNCCIIGTDSPDLPPEFIRQAYDLLENDETDAVFGPAEDGGYYLLGLRQHWQGLFADIPWSTPQVLEASLGRAKTLGLRTSLLPQWYDIDTLHDLLRLLDSPGKSAPRTREVANRVMKYETCIMSNTRPNSKEIGT